MSDDVRRTWKRPTGQTVYEWLDNHPEYGDAEYGVVQRQLVAARGVTPTNLRDDVMTILVNAESEGRLGREVNSFLHDIEALQEASTVRGEREQHVTFEFLSDEARAHLAETGIDVPDREYFTETTSTGARAVAPVRIVDTFLMRRITRDNVQRGYAGLLDFRLDTLMDSEGAQILIAAEYMDDEVARIHPSRRESDLPAQEGVFEQTNVSVVHCEVWLSFAHTDHRRPVKAAMDCPLELFMAAKPAHVMPYGWPRPDLSTKPIFGITLSDRKMGYTSFFEESATNQPQVIDGLRPDIDEQVLEGFKSYTGQEVAIGKGKITPLDDVLQNPEVRSDILLNNPQLRDADTMSERLLSAARNALNGRRPLTFHDDVPINPMLKGAYDTLTRDMTPEQLRRVEAEGRAKARKERG